VAYLEDRFGWNALVRMLRAWGERRSTPEVIERTLGISVDELDRDWRIHERLRLASRADDFAVDFARYRDVDSLRARAQAFPSDGTARALLAAALLERGEFTAAATVAAEAIRLDPHEPRGASQ
jgi:hypothetical protein